MVDALEIPDTIITEHRSVFSGLEALALTCAHFSSAGDLFQLSKEYNRSQGAISEIVNWVSTYIDSTWEHLLDFDHDHLLSPLNLQQYANAIHRAGAPLKGVWGFIDCTIRRISRPTLWQCQAYNGHKRVHALKFQAIMLPNGMFGHLFGPQEGRRNDSFLLNESGLLDQCAEFAVREGTDENTPDEEHYFQLFGDPAYGLSPHIQSPHSGVGVRTEEQLWWNELMSAVRIEVKHGFAVVANTWPFLNAAWKLHIGGSPVGHYYRTGVLLTNGLNCLRPNQVAQAFNCPPPLLKNYFHH